MYIDIFSLSKTLKCKGFCCCCCCSLFCFFLGILTSVLFYVHARYQISVVLLYWLVLGLWASYLAVFLWISFLNSLALASQSNKT